MVKNTTPERTESKRFEDTVRGDELSEGDRINRRLVARTLAQYGEPWNQNAPETQLVAVTAIDTRDDVHSALLADPDTGTLIRAGRHARSVARSQREADWKVREVGTTVAVEDVHELDTASNDDPVTDDAAYVEEWAELLFDDARHGYDDYSDERSLDGTTLTLRDVDSRRGVAEITLED